MREIKVKLCEITTQILSIGFEGEQNHTQVAFDCSPIFEEYPDAVATLAVKPPVGDVYPKNVTRDGNEVLWDVSASDCAHNGNGEYQITFVNGNEIIKTWTGNMRLYSSLLANGNPPEPIDDWIEDANAVLGSIENMTASAEGIPAGSDPTAEMSDIGGHKNIAFGIPAGEQGEQGEPGEDGFSPVITVTEITGGHRITIMDAEGIQTVDVLDGEKGDTGNGISSCVLNQDYTLTITYTNGQSYTTPSIRGAQGEQGNPGADGYSPTATVSKSGSVVTITITDKNGATSATVEDGEKGETGATPVISIGTVSTLEPGEPATASMDTTDPERPVLSLGIPEGQPGEVTQAEFDALRIAKADIITDTASGAIASFHDGADDQPVRELTVGIEPVQEGTGDPSPDNVRPITGWTGAKVTRTGVNIWDEEWETGQYNEITGEKKSNSQAIRSKNYIPVFPGTTYYAAFPTIMRVFKYDENFGYKGSFTIQNDTFTIQSDVRYLTINVGGTTIYNHDISINYPATDTEYHAYQGNTYDITFPSEAGTVYGGTLDVVTGELVVDRAYRQETAAEFEAFSSSNCGYYSTAAAVGNRPAVWFRNLFSSYGAKNRVSGGIKAICNMFELKMNDTSIFASQNRSAFVVDGTTINSVESFISAVRTAENNGGGLYIAYELKNLITYQLTPQEVRTLLGVNNIWADTGDTTVTYRADTKAYINKELSSTQKLLELIVTANREETMKATKAYSTGNLLIVNGTLYKATTSIANGANLTVGTNVTATTVANELALLA